MPTSPTANRPRSGEDGFSLIEALVSIAVIALLASLVMMTTPSAERRFESALERFAAFVTHGGEESVMTNRALTLTVTNEGYGFARQEADTWSAIPSGAALGFRRWPPETEIEIEGAQSGAGHVTTFDVLGVATPALIVVRHRGAAWQVRVESGGRVRVERLG